MMPIVNSVDNNSFYIYGTKGLAEKTYLYLKHKNKHSCGFLVSNKYNNSMSLFFGGYLLTVVLKAKTF